jgi:hypothetical protein
VSASARSPSHCFPHLFPEHFLLVFPSVAVAEEMLPRLGRRPASAAAPPAFVVVVAIVMIEKLDYILPKRATRPVYI